MVWESEADWQRGRRWRCPPARGGVFFERRDGKNKRKTKYNNIDDNRVLLQHPLYIVLVFPWLVFRHSVGVLDTACRRRYRVLSAPFAQDLHRQDVLDESWRREQYN